MIPGSFLEELRSRIPLSQVVAQKVKLKRSGREWSGLSPFNQEKSPSFFVNDQKAAWFDFSAGKTGDCFAFIMETEGLSFSEAVTRLASMVGIAMPAPDPEYEQREKRKASLIEVVEAANGCFRESLARYGHNDADAVQGADGDPLRRDARDTGFSAHPSRDGEAQGSPLAYLARRGIGPAEIERFEIGYAPASRSFLKQRLSPSCGQDALAEAGLLISGDDVPVSYDRFRDRVMFPIRDMQGKLVGFGGRVLNDDKPKYLNSPETPIFHKGDLLYNAHNARQPAHDGAPLVVVEGYTATIASVAAGLPATVATLGTAATDRHLLQAWRMHEAPILCFDGDAAGRRAAAKVVTLALPLLLPGRTLRFAMMPVGEDPDDVVRKRGPGPFKRMIEAAKGLPDMIWQVFSTGKTLTTPDALAVVEAEAVEALNKIPDNQLRKKYLRDLHERIEAVPGRVKPMRSNGHSRHSTSPAALRLVHGLGEKTAMSLKDAMVLAAIITAPADALNAPDGFATGLSAAGQDTASQMLMALAGGEGSIGDLMNAGLGSVVEQVYATVHSVGITALDLGADPTRARSILRRA